MKKVMLRICIGIVIIYTVGCSTISKKPKTYIEKVQLSEEEADIVTLLDINKEQLIYDFRLDEKVKTLQISTYKLIDGTWRMISRRNGFSPLGDKDRFVLDFDNIAEGLRFGLQSGQSHKYSVDPQGDFSEMARVTSTLNERVDVTYEQEIPLAIQILSSQDMVSSYGVESFFTPEEYEKNGYEHVYAITIMFSEKTIMELDEIE